MSIEKAIAYVKNTDALSKVFASVSYTTDLEKPCIVVGAHTVKIQQLTFADNTLGTYSASTGYANKEFNIAWVTKELTQDKGDSISLDRMDDEEALVGGIVTLHNKYIKNVQAPGVDTYRFGVMASGAGKKTYATLTKANVADAIYDAYEELLNKGVSTSGLILYVSPTIDGLLRKSQYDKGHVTFGTWNGQIDTQVRLFEEAKIVVVPSSILGANTNFILVHKDAVNAQKKYEETVVNENVAGFGHRKIVLDEGIYHDCWLEPGGEVGVVFHGITQPAA